LACAAIQIGGYARGYHECFASVTAWQIPLWPRRSVGHAVFYASSRLV
jgi:hypothetical protein